MSLFYRQNWDIVAFILTNDKREPCHVRMRRIMTEAVLISVQYWLQTVLCILKTIIENIMLWNDVTLVDLSSSGTPKQRTKPWNHLLSTRREMISIGKPEVCNV